MPEVETREEAQKKFNDWMEDFTKNVRVEGQIEFPIEVASVESVQGRAHKAEKVGSWCSVRPCSDNKTYLGIYLGDLIVSTDYYFHVEKKALTLAPHCNPAIYVPDLKRVVWGCESWWGIIDTPDKLRKISDADIQNIWYVKALKELLAPEKP